MTITASGYTANLFESIQNQLQTTIGATYNHAGLGLITITFVSGGYPADITTYKNQLPLIILDHSNRPEPTQFEIGGKRTYTNIFYVHVIAGGYGDDTANALMQFGLTDKICFGFDLKTFTLTNYDSSVTEGIYHTRASEVVRVSEDETSVYEQHHSEILLTVTADILN